MKFRLTYEGVLRPTGRDPTSKQRNPLAEHKHCIRRRFHGQLKQLWQTNRFLREHKVYGEGPYTVLSAPTDVRRAREMFTQEGEPYRQRYEPRALVDVVAADNPTLGLPEYRWVALVREEIGILCSLNILFLRRDPPGSALSAGDIDNRVRTVIDALRIPQSPNELVGEDAEPRVDERPFFCLLQDDKQVSRFVVETDQLLDPPARGDAETERQTARLVITVELRPYDITQFNLGFA